MKVSQDVRTQMETSKQNNLKQTNAKSSFQSVVGQETQKLKETELNRLLADLTKQGEKVAKFRSFQDLGKYKKMVRQFIQETVNSGLDLEQSRKWDLEGGSQTLSLVKQIDDKLIELTDDVLDQEKDSIDVLDVIGEIKGMLLNLYA
ncbi:YaaR family protein [Alkalibacillus haloalkaliphilus]|uniref:YaaR family protein n=1 Tax=Alkalibacillus haloalkaliphilus TaxID=94136 RepID=UPI0002F894CC|nr:YaaR family protein [Alkalibacillus haloalkaliphilus]